MTYCDASEFKKKLGKDRLVEDNMTFRVLITPYNDPDFTRYLEDYRIGGFTDKTALDYCSNGQFAVQGLWTDGASVIHKKLS